MKLFFTTLCLFWGITLSAQDCKPFYEGKDEFTGNSLIYYGGELDESGFFSDKNLMVSFIVGKADDSLTASIFIRRQIMDKEDVSERQETMDELRIKKGQMLYLSLSNGESVKMTAISDSKREKKKILSTVVISTVNVYNFTPSQVKLLAENTITGYRIELAETILQNKKLKANRTTKLKAQFACAVQKFN